MFTPPAPWWKGTRGEWYVVTQIALFSLVVFGPSGWPALPEWEPPYSQLSFVVGAVFLAMGGLLVVSGILKLGANLTALPYPKNDAKLVVSGPYRIVRHPMYSGGTFVALGWALVVHGLLTLGYAVVLFLFFDFKSRREEAWLKAKFPDYLAYQQRVRKLIPFVY